MLRFLDAILVFTRIGHISQIGPGLLQAERGHLHIVLHRRLGELVGEFLVFFLAAVGRAVRREDAIEGVFMKITFIKINGLKVFAQIVRHSSPDYPTQLVSI